MTGSFQITRSFLIPPIALKYLEKTIKKTPGCVETIESVIEGMDSNQGFLYLVKQDEEIFGAIYAAFVPNPNGKDIFNLILLGGKSLREWKEDLRFFVKKTIRETNTDLCIVTRPAWGKYYPELKHVGSVYMLSGNGDL
jgi:hypothetical protein